MKETKTIKGQELKNVQRLKGKTSTMNIDYLLINSSDMLKSTWEILCNIIHNSHIKYECYTLEDNIYLKLKYKNIKKLKTRLHEFYYYNNVEKITKNIFYSTICDYDVADYLITDTQAKA